MPPSSPPPGSPAPDANRSESRARRHPGARREQFAEIAESFRTSLHDSLVECRLDRRRRPKRIPSSRDDGANRRSDSPRCARTQQGEANLSVDDRSRVVSHDVSRPSQNTATQLDAQRLRHAGGESAARRGDLPQCCTSSVSGTKFATSLATLAAPIVHAALRLEDSTGQAPQPSGCQLW